MRTELARLRIDRSRSVHVNIASWLQQR